MKTKRLIISTLMGLIFGFVCYGLASGGPNSVPAALAISIILSRTLIGVAIGISSFTLKHWSLHGIVMGFVFSLPMGFGAMIGPEDPAFTPAMLLVSSIVLGMVYGFLIELVATVFFKAKQVV